MTQKNQNPANCSRLNSRILDTSDLQPSSFWAPKRDKSSIRHGRSTTASICGDPIQSFGEGQRKTQSPRTSTKTGRAQCLVKGKTTVASVRECLRVNVPCSSDEGNSALIGKDKERHDGYLILFRRVNADACQNKDSIDFFLWRTLSRLGTEFDESGPPFVVFVEMEGFWKKCFTAPSPEKSFQGWKVENETASLMIGGRVEMGGF